MATMTDTQVGPGFLTRNGDFFPVRPLTLADTATVRDFYLHGLSDHSRRERFLTPTPRMSHAAVRALSDKDGYRKVALAAFDNETIVGIAEYAWNPATPDELPEVAYAVADAYQGQGIGGVLLQMLAALSIAGGHTTWQAAVLSSNKASLALLTKVGQVHLVNIAAGIEELHVNLDTPA